ncbi:RNA-binding domain-containing protein [Hypoxylon sp. FL1284]|nr:RNA-binding domain-containing protein [Hypoxylon sp. FL1284]
MSYPPPPGSNSSLPPRPPPSRVSGFKPAFSPAPPAHTPSPGAAVAHPYAAPAPPPAYAGSPASHYGAPPSSSSSTPSSSYQPYARPASVSGGGTRYQQPAAYQYPGQGQQPGAGGYQQQQQGYYGGPQTAAASYAAPPQIRNPFPAPSSGGHQAGRGANDDYDPEMAAQIAQWQSAYVKDPSREGAGTPGAPAAAPGRNNGGAATAYSADPSVNPAAGSVAAAAAAAAAAGQAAGGAEKKKTVVRSGGGQKWTDDTLLEWDPSHLRLFVGNLAGETTDESLYKAFAQWRSLQKARVIRDKVASKSKGYGFVSFSDPDDFFQAAKEMNGKYIQSHPVVVRKSTTEIKPTSAKDRNHSHHNGGRWSRNNKNKNRGGNGNGNGAGGGGGGGKQDAGYEPRLGPAPAGVHKPGQKTKGGLKLLG